MNIATWGSKVGRETLVIFHITRAPSFVVFTGKLIEQTACRLIGLYFVRVSSRVACSTLHVNIPKYIKKNCQHKIYFFLDMFLGVGLIDDHTVNVTS